MINNKRILVLLAHPSIKKSEINRPLFSIAQSLDYVTYVDLYAEYPRFNIDIEKEQQRLLEHDVIIFLFPLYWYSAPALLQEWKELVLEYKFAYGLDAQQLKGKSLLCAVSVGAKEKDYCVDGKNHHSLDDFLSPFAGLANICRMRYLPPFSLFSIRSALTDGRLEKHKERWVRLLTYLHEEKTSTDILDWDFLDTLKKSPWEE